MSTGEGFDCPDCGEELDIPSFFDGECHFCGDDFDPFQTIKDKYPTMYKTNEKKKL